MRVTISKILNRTDLAQSGSHGGLVVTKADQSALRDFFETPGVDQSFLDPTDNEVFSIHYQDYTSNGTTPNDRITPIGRYATKHNLQPGDILVFDKTKNPGGKSYMIEYARKLESVFFAGKSKTTVDILNFEQLIGILAKNVDAGNITRVSATEFEMQVVFLGILGQLRIEQSGDDYELYFNGVPISENKKYYELDTSVKPFILKKTETWRIVIDIDEDEIAANEEADAKLIAEMVDINTDKELEEYHPMPEEKAPEKESKGRKVPDRSKKKSENALARARYCCEVGNHETFLRKKNRLPYTEPHHLIPLQYDSQFEYSLDVEANIVSLCSNCHNQLHYGDSIENIIRHLWELRKEELDAAGILKMKNGVELTIDILLGFYGVV